MRRKAPGERAESAESADVPSSPPAAGPVSRPVRVPLGRDDEIAAGVHEVQNALTSVLGWVEVASTSDDAAMRTRALQVIESGLLRAKTLVARLSDPAARLAVDTRAFRVVPTLSETHELLHPRCASVGVTLGFDPRDDDLVALGDPDRVVQIVTNLVLNAIDAVLAVPSREPPRGRVDLGVRYEERTVSIIVRDDGIGMDEATRARVFEPYFTTHPNSEGRRKAGSGLGLAVSRALAEAMGASLHLVSTVGAGTTVTLTLARDGATHTAEAASAASELRAGTRVLVVDDEPAIRELLEVALALRGAEVVTASTLAEARAALARHEFHAALIDETLGPNESGASLMLDLASGSPHIARILMTGAPSVEHLPPEVAQNLLRKPFALSEVVRLIAARIHARR